MNDYIGLYNKQNCISSRL